MSQITTLILAAGEGKRMKSDLPKVLHEIFEKPVLSYVLEASYAVKSTNACIVIGHKAEEIEKRFKSEKINFVYQKEQLGTGHAVKTAIDFIPDGDILILFGDAPLITGNSLKKLVKQHRKNKNHLSLLSAKMDNPFGFGRIVRDRNGKFIKVIEEKDANENEKSIAEINSGLYLFNGKTLKAALELISNDNAQKEYYLTDTIEIVTAMKLNCEAILIDDSSECFGFNSREQLAIARNLLKKRVNKKLMDEGVSIIDPENTYISPDVTIGQDSTIYPNCYISGKTKIGKNNVIESNCKISDSTIGDNNEIMNTVMSETVVGDNNKIGPFAFLRPGTKIASNCKVGDFVELKNTEIASGSKVSHLAYLGDSKIGENVNVGCGVVTANYDGKKKFSTIVEDGVFLGSNSTLIAPVRIKKDACIAAGSTITQDVSEKALAIARARQIEKKNWKKGD